MLVSTIISRVRYQVEDVNSDVYTEAEMLAALNTVKDEVLAMVISNADIVCSKSESISFAVGEKEKAVNSSALGILRVESTPPDATYPYEHEFDDFRDQDSFDPNDDQQRMYIRWGEDNTKIYLGRRQTDKALTVTVYYITEIADYVSTTQSVIFAPLPACNLMVTKMTNLLLASRKRDNRVFLNQEMKQENLLGETLSRLKRTGPRYVHYQRD